MFDKDNTLTAPFAATVEPRLIESLGACQRAFGAGGVVLYSNSAGLKQYDPDGKTAGMCVRMLPCIPTGIGQIGCALHVVDI